MEWLETGKSDFIGIDILHFHSTLATFPQAPKIEQILNITCNQINKG